MSGTLGSEQVTEIQERSDFDPHQSVASQESVLGEHLGDGFFLNTEPVLVQRGRDGRILRTVPLSEAMLMVEKQKEAQAKLPPKVGKTRPILHPLPTSQREKLAGILANRLFQWYLAQPPNPAKYNPVYDGIPEAPEDNRALQPLPGTKLYPATRFEVYEWLRRVVASRVQLINKKKGARGWTGDISDYAVRIHRTAPKE